MKLLTHNKNKKNLKLHFNLNLNESLESSKEQKINLLNKTKNIIIDENSSSPIFLNNDKDKKYYSIKNVNKTSTNNNNDNNNKIFLNYFKSSKINKFTNFLEENYSNIKTNNIFDLDKKMNDSKEIKIINKFKLFNKNPLNLEYNNATKIKNKRYKIKQNILIDDIIKEKEREYNLSVKKSSDNLILKKFKSKTSFYRESKYKKKIFTKYIRTTTSSLEHKKKIPVIYNSYLNTTKNLYDSMNQTYTDLKNDIEYHNLVDIQKYQKKGEYAKKLLKKKYMEIENMKDAISINKLPIVENYEKNKKKEKNKNKEKKGKKQDKENKGNNEDNKMMEFSYLWKFDELKNLNENIAFAHRKFFANKYGIELKRNLIDSDINVDDFLVKLKKSLAH